MTAIGVSTSEGNALQTQLSEAHQITADATERSTAVESIVKVLQADLTKENEDVTRLTTDLATANLPKKWSLNGTCSARSTISLLFIPGHGRSAHPCLILWGL